MKYRWGFLDENDTFTECFPIVEDSTSLDYAQQSGEIFYRAKLNGELAFRFEFQDILDKGYNYEHYVVLQYFDTDDEDWRDIWKGRFSLTDCTIDYDSNTITVSPETVDRYTKILDDWDKEYNIVKLAPPMQPVNILIRPLIQVYEVMDSKISNYVGNNYWEADCTPVERNNIDNYKFGYQQQYISATITWAAGAYSGTQYAYRGGKTISYVGEVIYGGLPQESTRVYGQYWDGAEWQTDTLRVRVAQMTDYTYFLFYGLPEISGDQQTKLFQAKYIAYGMGTAAEIEDLFSTVEEAYSQWDMICARILCNTELDSIDIQGTTYTISDIPSDDMAGGNLNYNKVFYAPIMEIKVSGDVQDEPTQWGKTINDKYFVKPADSLGVRWIPVGQSMWRYFSIWYRITNVAMMDTINDELTANQTIADSYRLDQATIKLLRKAGWTGTYWISRALNGNNDYVGESSFVPVITAKSNVISSYYNSPAQNAPLSLTKIFAMLKQAYRIYWHIDDNGNIHVEHISYYDNGYSYTESSPTILIDLESEIHTNTKEHKAYGQNKVTFDKENMPAQFTFGWADEQTVPFNGYPIDCLDQYVNKGTQEQNNIGSFDTDVDYVLSSPNNVSKDGFFLFAVPTSGGTTDWTLKVESVRVYDIDGNPYEAVIQNADGAFVKIHQSWWRYALPCERVNINNEDTNAITTGKYKVQSLEFADVAMAEILKNVDNCNLVFRTQQGNGYIKTLSINLNSLTAKADLLFNFIGRWYYLKGTALGASFNITINGEQVTINVSNNTFIHRYKEAITALTFDGADVVSVNFADCDNLDNLTSCDNMFKNCGELIAVDFAGKKMSAVLSATDMFDGCANLTTLICPDSSTWKADLDFSDCPNLTTDSLYDLIKYLYVYDSGVHTITPNSTMWQSLDGAVQDDLIAKAAERGWTIAIPAQYSVTGTSSASTVYATINGNAIEIDVVGGNWSYDYNTPITSISFEGDANVQTIDFSLTDGLAGVTSLDNAFKDCTMLTSVDFTNCDLTNVVSASDCFANCGSLFNVTIPSNTWKPNVDFSTCPLIAYAEMQGIVGGLYTYTSGLHTITWNSTYWDSLTYSEQTNISNAASAKEWQTNAVMTIYVIKGKSTAASETFTIGFIDDQTQTTAWETITVNVDGNGDWEYQYNGKKIYSLADSFRNNQTITQIEFNENFEAIVSMYRAFASSNIQKVIADNGIFSQLDSLNLAFNVMPQLTEIYFPNATFASVTDAYGAFAQTSNIISKIILPNATFASCLNARLMFNSVAATEIRMPNATFANCTDANSMFVNCASLTTLDISNATFASVTDAESMFQGCAAMTAIDLSGFNLSSATTIRQMFQGCTSLTSIDLSGNTFASATTALSMFQQCSHLTSVDLSDATFTALQNAQNMFYQCTTLTSVDLSGTTFASLTTMYQMFQGCTALTSVDLSGKTFANVTTTYQMFFQCTSLTSVNMSNATFAANANTYLMFYQCSALTSISISNATFATLTDAAGMFRGCNHLTSLDLNSATFANLQRAWLMFDGCTLLQSLNMTNATFAKVNDSRSLVSGCNALTTWTLTQQSTAILPTANVGNTPIDAHWSPLSYQSMLNVANWLSDLSGQTAHTCTFKTSAWNALSAAEQTNIDTILSGKNWNRAIA